MMMRGRSVHFALLGVVFVMLPFAFLGLESLWRPVREAESTAYSVIELPDGVSRQPPRNSNAAPTAKSTGNGFPSIIPNEREMWTPELPMEKIDLSMDTIVKSGPYELYHDPTNDWFERAQQKVAPYLPKLKDALAYIDDPEQRITMVTCLFDLGRDKLKGFNRGFNEYIARFQRVIDVGLPMVIFMEGDKVSSFKWKPEQKITIIPFSIEELVSHYPTYFDRIEEIRFSQLYKRQAKMTGWLAESPQASLKYYNLMVMTKLFVLRYAAKLNPWRTQYHMFVDAGHLCGPMLKKTNLNLLRKHMGRMMVTYFEYGAGLHGESHGMPQKAYRHYVGPPFDDHNTWEKEWCCNIVRGGIFGGTPTYIDAVAEAYNEILAQSLADGYMGTEENILGATYYRFPDLFNAFKNPGGDNCAIFSSSTREGVDNPIYEHPPVSDEWHVA